MVGGSGRPVNSMSRDTRPHRFRQIICTEKLCMYIYCILIQLIGDRGRKIGTEGFYSLCLAFICMSTNLCLIKLKKNVYKLISGD